MINSFQTNCQAMAPWLPRMMPKAGSTLRLFCFPYAGGTTYTYSSWDSQLSPLIQVCPVELPGRAARMNESPETSIVRLVKSMASALLPCLDKPFVFFGHSMGALVSFELARELRRSHQLQPAHMFVSACLSPRRHRSREKVTYNLPEREFIETLRRLNGTPKEVLEHSELMQLAIPLLRADFEACQTYEYVAEPPLDCPLTVVGGLQDNQVTRADLEDWCEQTTSTCTLRMLTGDHLFINSAQKLILGMLMEELFGYTR